MEGRSFGETYLVWKRGDKYFARASSFRKAEVDFSSNDPVEVIQGVIDKINRDGLGSLRITSADYQDITVEVKDGVTMVVDGGVNNFNYTCNEGGIVEDYNRRTRLYSGEVKEVYNIQKGRMEWWSRLLRGDREWELRDAKPARVWKDGFINPGGFLSTVLGYSSELLWGVNGVRGGANPNANNFEPANDVGGGVVMKALTGNADGDYTALHWGGDYPTKVECSPHMRIHVNFEDTEDVGYMGGLGDDTRSTGTDALVPHDNFIGVTYDTGVDDNMYFFITVDGAAVVGENLGPIPDPHSTGVIRVNDNGDAVTFILNGSIVGTYEVELPTVQLQPYAMVQILDSTAVDDKELHLHDFRLIMDRDGGFGV